MKRIIFLYGRNEGYFEGNLVADDKAEQEIRYWLGKSPGGHTIEDILIINSDAIESGLPIMKKVRDEDAEYVIWRREEQEKAEFERLKRKFAP